MDLSTQADTNRCQTSILDHEVNPIIRNNRNRLREIPNQRRRVVPLEQQVIEPRNMPSRHNLSANRNQNIQGEEMFIILSPEIPNRNPKPKYLRTSKRKDIEKLLLKKLGNKCENEKNGKYLKKEKVRKDLIKIEWKIKGISSEIVQNLRIISKLVQSLKQRTKTLHELKKRSDENYQNVEINRLSEFLMEDTSIEVIIPQPRPNLTLETKYLELDSRYAQFLQTKQVEASLNSMFEFIDLKLLKNQQELLPRNTSHVMLVFELIQILAEIAKIFQVLRNSLVAIGKNSQEKELTLGIYHMLLDTIQELNQAKDWIRFLALRLYEISQGRKYPTILHETQLQYANFLLCTSLQSYHQKQTKKIKLKEKLLQVYDQINEILEKNDQEQRRKKLIGKIVRKNKQPQKQQLEQVLPEEIRQNNKKLRERISNANVIYYPNVQKVFNEISQIILYFESFLDIDELQEAVQSKQRIYLVYQRFSRVEQILSYAVYLARPLIQSANKRGQGSKFKKNSIQKSMSKPKLKPKHK